LTSSIALAIACKPLPLATMIGFFAPAGLTGAAPIASVLRLAAAAEVTKRRRLIEFLMVLRFPINHLARSKRG